MLKVDKFGLNIVSFLFRIDIPIDGYLTPAVNIGDYVRLMRDLKLKGGIAWR
jgi:hypothetical protein